MQTISSKVNGSIALWESLKGKPSHFFVMFSSFNSILPQRNSVDYTTANAFEDAMGEYIRNRGVNTWTLNWGAWGETGAGKSIDVDSQENSKAVMRAWRTEDGLKAMVTAMSYSPSQYVIVDLNRQKFLDFPFFQRSEAISVDLPVHTLHDGELSETESRVLTVWRNVLGKTEIGIDDNFFEMGGHSLLASRILNLLAKEFRVKLTFRELLMNPSVRSLTVCLEASQGVKKSGIEPIQQLPTRELYPVSYAQKHFWA
ncbi:MAG: KR domain-containing protein, partial [Flammeovirgaceae bacterium]